MQFVAVGRRPLTEELGLESVPLDDAVSDADAATWTLLARWFAEAQLRAIADAAALVMSSGARAAVVGQAPPRGTGVRAGRTHPGSSGSGQRAAGRQSVASFRAALAGVAGVPRLAPRCGPSAAGRRE